MDDLSKNILYAVVVSAAFIVSGSATYKLFKRKNRERDVTIRLISIILVGIFVLIWAIASRFIFSSDPILPPYIVINLPTFTIYSQPNGIKDAAGKRASFVVVVSKDLNWKLGSTKEVEYHQEPTTFKQHVVGTELEKHLLELSTIITVGAASYELAADQNPLTEDLRSDNRAEQMQLWIKEYVPTRVPLYTLSLGKNISSVPVNGSSKQRLLVILGISNAEAGFDIGSLNKLEVALRSALATTEAFPFKIDDYKKFKLESMRN